MRKWIILGVGVYVLLSLIWLIRPPRAKREIPPDHELETTEEFAAEKPTAPSDTQSNALNIAGGLPTSSEAKPAAAVGVTSPGDKNSGALKGNLAPDLKVNEAKKTSRKRHPNYSLEDLEAPSYEKFMATRPRDLQSLLSPPRPFFDYRTPFVGVLGHDLVGTIDVNGTILRYRQSIDFRSRGMLTPESCVALQSPSQEEIFGSLGDGSLQIFEGPHRTSHIFALHQTHYFYVLYCSRGEEDCGRWPLMVMLYYLKQSDGRITYQGKANHFFSLGSKPYKEPSKCHLQFINRTRQ